MKFFLFYSNRCNICNELIRIIEEKNLNSECCLIDIDNEITKNKIPKYINTIPTIISNELYKPLIGKDILEWIENKKYFNQITNNVKKNNVINPNIVCDVDKLSYNKDELKSISDKYTNINDETHNMKNLMEINKEKINNLTHLSDKKIKVKDLILLRKNNRK